MEVKAELVLSSSLHLEQSQASSACHSQEEPVGWVKSTPKVMGGMEDHPLSVNEAPEASAKGSGYSATNWSDSGAVDDGGLAFATPDTGHQSTLPCSKSLQLYTLRRNPRPSRRFEAQGLIMELRASAVARKSSNEHQCTECGRDFVSSRALAGHMRCHPEREGRGNVCAKRKNVCSDSSKLSSQLHSSPCQSENQTPKFDFDDQSDSDSIEAAYMNGKVKSKLDAESQSDADSIEAAYMNGKVKSKLDAESQSEAESIEAAYKNLKFTSKSDFENQSDAESREAARVKGEFKPSCRNWTTGKRSKRSHQPGRPLQSDPPTLKSELQLQPTAGKVNDNKNTADLLVMLAYAGKIQHESAREAAARGLSDWERSQRITLRSGNGAARAKGGMEWKRSIRSPKMERQENNQSAEQKERMQPDPAEIDAKFQIECNICKRVFKSHQALGGHRASHKKVKGCFAKGRDCDRSSKEDLTHEDMAAHGEPDLRIHAQRIPVTDEDEIARSKHTNKAKSNPTPRIKPHKCSICQKSFQSGQALGGHKRCHWGGSTSLESSFLLERNGKAKISRGELLDRHLPAPDSAIPDLKVASTPNPMHLLKTKSGSNHQITDENDPLRLVSLSDGAPHTESRSSSPHRLPRAASSCDEKLQASSIENSMLDDPANALAFAPWYVQRNICDQVSSSIANLSNHQRNHPTPMASVAGLTPISA